MDARNHSRSPETTSPTGGYAATVGAFFLWGIFPIYWKLFEDIPPFEVIGYRVLWSLAFLALVVPLRGHVRQYWDALRTPRLLGLHVVSGLLLACNWVTFVYSVQSGQIVEASLGYFLNPLLSVILGAVVLRERLRPLQWSAVGLAAVGVLVQVIQLGALPWIALVLASTFALYGLARKQGPLGSLTGLAVEATVIFPIAVAYLLVLAWAGSGTVEVSQPGQMMLLATMGIVTTTPLLLFASGARALPLSTVGIIQYLAPSLHLLVGLGIYHEPFGHARFVSFLFIWVALAVFTVDGVRRSRRRVIQTVEPGPVPTR